MTVTKMIYAYINPNSVAFSFSDQKSAIEGWCDSESRKVDSFLTDEGELFSLPKNGDYVVVCDFARLCQEKGKILALIKYYLSNGICVVSANRGIVLNPSKISAEVLSLVIDAMNEIDFSIASEKTKKGLVKAIEKGHKCGRRTGQRPEKVKLSGHEEEIRNALSMGETKAALARRYNVTWITMNEFVKTRL